MSGVPAKSGDKKKIDVVVTSGNPNVHFAMEMKWAREKRALKIGDDIDKLKKYREAHKDADCLLCLFGVMSVLQK